MDLLYAVDWLDAGLRGGIIAAVGISLYMFKKSADSRENKREMAGILRNEINRILNILPSRIRERISSNKRHERNQYPDNRVYAGLLHTGNIRFFNKELQDDLNEWYAIVDDFKFRKI